MPTDFIDIKRQYSLVEVANRYIETRQKGKDQVGLCPFHDDSKPSFTIFMGKDGIERYRCFSCDAAGDVIDFVANIEGVSSVEAGTILTGANERKRMPAAPDTRVAKPLKKSELDQWQPILPVPDGAPIYDPSRTYNPDAGVHKDWTRGVQRQDPYFDGDGNLMFWVVRLDWGDGSEVKMCPVVSYCQGPNGKREWVAKRPDILLPLQGLHELTTNPNKPVLIVSGEKCYAQASDIQSKFTVVSWIGGDNAVAKTDWTPLIGCPMIFFSPDKDESGRRAMKDICLILENYRRENELRRH